MKGSHSRRGPRVAHLALAALSALTLAGADAPAHEVGFVAAFRGDAAGYRIERGAERLPVRVLALLQAGDVVHVEAAEGRIELRLASGDVTVLEGGAAPFRVEPAAGENTVSMNIVRWLGDWVQGRFEAAEAPGVSLAARGSGALAAPLFADGVRLAAGPRASLQLAWSGGSPPFGVRLTDAAGHTLVELETPAASASTGPFALAPGAFALRLSDASGAAVTVRGDAVAAPPAAPATLAAAELDAPLRETLAAAWLASQEAGAWRLEAYQRAAALAVHYAPALALRDALAAGDTPPALPEDGAPR